MERTAAWLRSRTATRVLDGALVVAAVVVGWAGMFAARHDDSVQSGAWTVPLALVSAATAAVLLWRRRWPLGSLAALVLGMALASAIDERGLFSAQIALEVVVLCFALGAWSNRRLLAPVVIVALLAIVVVGSVADDGSVVAAFAFGFALVGLPAALGFAARTRRQYVAEVEARLVAAENDRDERARHAVIEERARIARELHDVVAHHVSLIGVQAGAARTALDRSPDSARVALAGIEASSRAAVSEMRQLLDVLAPLPSDAERSDNAFSRAPQPGLEQLVHLVQHWSAAGLSITTEFTGDPTKVPPTVSLCSYRIVEEALTNVVRHSAAASASVRVHVGDVVTIAVDDPGPARPRDAVAPGTGRGVIGLRERAALFGGTAAAHATPAGGFRVTATIPWTAR